ncbi:hypothetical protein [Actinophytocola sp. NPDC049390]|uniref:hypothetical protein n=1 Tax=Actinophytocola sp. NPDC049390 TaxID=3363894 RepID=UPI00378D3E4A
MWVNGPVGMGADQRALHPTARSVLVVVPYVVTGTRLADVLPLLATDHRVTTVFTVPLEPNGSVCHSAEEFVRALGGLVIPWQQAVHTEFDLILAASPTGLAQLHGKIVLLSYGATVGRSFPRAGSAGVHANPTAALDHRTLIDQGRLLPTVLALSHDVEIAELRDTCPEAVSAAVVAGDVSYDRLMASLPLRGHYREALGLAAAHRLVVVSSSWQPDSTLGRHPRLLDDLVTELPRARYRVAAVLHPNIWHVHGPFQVRAWLADATRRGLLLLPPEEGWRAALAAADVLIGDHGSVTRYGAAIGVPTVVTGSPEQDLRPGSSADLLYRFAQRLRPSTSLAGQIGSVSIGTWQAELDARLTARPGQAARILRSVLYRELGIPEPEQAVQVTPVPMSVEICRSTY